MVDGKSWFLAIGVVVAVICGIVCYGIWGASAAFGKVVFALGLTGTFLMFFADRMTKRREARH